MSKPSSAADRNPGEADLGKIRLFRNFYTRKGSRHYVRGWRIKVQIGGRRATHALRSGDRAAAAAEAARLVQHLRVQQRGNTPEPVAGRVRLVRRPHLPPAVDPAQWSVCLPSGGRPEYFPLGASHAEEATRRARQLHRDLRRHGLSGIHDRHPREVTVALHWSANPV
ncbi:MAG: hypothetical protein J0L84_09420, partial [Verrucomicrobia bacterium]|nr:hypothetical protein [Verrucomicrobiota bacterium]